jgi:hypothetical protein
MLHTRPLVLSFAGDVPLEAVAEVAESHGVGGTPRHGPGGTVRLSSPAFEARHEGSRSRTSWTSNAPLHKWFRRSAVPMLLELERAHGLRGVQIEV